MPIARRTETMIALKAAQTAIRVARDVGYPRVDVNDVFCAHCNAQLDWRNKVDVDLFVTCPACGTRTELPSHLRQYVRPVIVPRYDGPVANAQHRPLLPCSMRTALLFFFISMAVLTAVILLEYWKKLPQF